MDLAVCSTDDDYDAWRKVRITVAPTERCPTVDELKAFDTQIWLLMLARLDGTVVGSGIAGLSETSGAAFTAPRVLPEHRRQGVGSALLHAVAEHCNGLGVPNLQSGVDDEGSLAFATRFGFREVDREVEQVREVGDEVTPSPPPSGVEIVTLAIRPELWSASYEGFGKEALQDFAVHTPLEISAEQWETEWRADSVFLALSDGDVIGCAGLYLDPDQPDRAEHSLTAVRRDWRGRGVAAHLKRLTLEWAAANGLREVYTWTQAGNESMLRLNRHLGYVDGRTGITVSRTLPLTT